MLLWLPLSPHSQKILGSNAFGGEVNWLLTSGVKESACWLWQSLSNLVWCRCSLNPPADKTSVIRKRDAQTFNNRSFSLSLWVVSVRGSVCVYGWIICQLLEQFMLILHPLLLYYVSVWDHQMHRIRKKNNLPSDKQRMQHSSKRRRAPRN